MSPGIHAGVRRRVRYVQAHAEASARARTGVESAAGGRRPLAHADEAEPGARRHRGTSDVRDLQFHAIGAVAHADVGGRARTPVPACVRERLLCDAVDVDLDELG